MSIYYTDIDVNLTKNVQSNDISLKYDVNAIAQSIKNIVLTNKNERIFNTKVGANTDRLIAFKTLLPFELTEVRLQILAELNLEEPRATITNIDIKDTGLGYWQVSVSFTPIFDKNLVKTVVIILQ
jgi:phage baseplate assembly protein W